VLLAEAADLTDETHHLENARRDTMADFISGAESVRACEFDVFLERLEEAVDKTDMNAALTETLENFSLYDGVSPQARARRLEVMSERTQMLLADLGLAWPSLPAAGQAEMLSRAAQLYPGTNQNRAGLEKPPCVTCGNGEVVHSSIQIGNVPYKFNN